jgi:hypothetical protein
LWFRETVRVAIGLVRSWFCQCTALLGLIAVLAGGIFGGVNPAVRYSIALVPIVMGSHLLGIIKINIPAIGKWSPIQTGTLSALLTGSRS